MIKKLGKKKTLLALGHTILKIVYHILTTKIGYQEYGPDYAKRSTHKSEKEMIRRLQELGYTIAKSA